MFKAIFRKIDLVILVVIALVAATLTILNFFNLAPTFKMDYPLFTLFLLSMIGVHLVVSHFTNEVFQDETQSALVKVLSEAKNSEYREYKDSSEIEGALAKRILDAKLEVCDLSWKLRISQGFSASDRQISHTYMDTCINKISSRVPYREIYTFGDPRRVQKLERRLSENNDGYSCAYFDDVSEIPRMQFVIVDKEDIFFFAISPEAPLCSFKSKELCRVFLAYYESTWAKATVIKDGPQVFSDVVSEIMKLKERAS